MSLYADFTVFFLSVNLWNNFEKCAKIIVFFIDFETVILYNLFDNKILYSAELFVHI